MMALERMKLLILVGLCLSLMDGIRAGRILFEEEDLEPERQLKILNKPPVKTIQLKGGDIIDCIDIKKQPAFDHPLLRNHKLQMKPSYISKKINGGSSSGANAFQVDNGNIGCPSGTVPILRTTKEDLVRARSISNSIYDQRKNISSNSDPPVLNHYTILRRLPGEYHGVQASMTVYGLTNVLADQLSATAVWVLNSANGSFEAITTGWHVFPKINGDAKTRFFTFWTSNGYKQGCHNLQCPGFVQVSSKVHPGAVVSPLSEVGGTQYFLTLLVSQDRSSGNWWLYYGNEKEPVGYWPKSLFTSLANSASEVRWGGNVVSPTSEPSPPMGSGHFSQEGDSRACYFMNMKNLDAGYAMSGPDVWNTEKQSDLPGFYGEGQLLIEGQPRGHVYSFGGPGGYKQG